jgi:hypothetical protein
MGRLPTFGGVECSPGRSLFFAFVTAAIVCGTPALSDTIGLVCSGKAQERAFPYPVERWPIDINLDARTVNDLPIVNLSDDFIGAGGHWTDEAGRDAETMYAIHRNTGQAQVIIKRADTVIVMWLNCARATRLF